MRCPGLEITFFVVLGVARANAACTPEQIEAFIRSGISGSTIEQACGSSDRVAPQFQTPYQQQQTSPIAQVCQTSLGTCMMMVPMPIGQSCTCPSVWGPVVGLSR
jgi:hypothetical protein